MYDNLFTCFTTALMVIEELILHKKIKKKKQFLVYVNKINDAQNF